MNPWQHGQHTHDLPTWKTDGQKPKRAIPPHAASLGSPGAVTAAAGWGALWLAEPSGASRRAGWDVQGGCRSSLEPTVGCFLCLMSFPSTLGAPTGPLHSVHVSTGGFKGREGASSQPRSSSLLFSG